MPASVNDLNIYLNNKIQDIKLKKAAGNKQNLDNKNANKSSVAKTEI